MKVLIYRDKGVNPTAFFHLFSTLRQVIPHYTIEEVDHLFLLTKPWESSTSIIAFPGGRDLPYHTNLQGEGNARIRNFVEKGGKFLGICAGGYYGSSYIEFEKGEANEICGSRELAFFPGKAIGPVYEKGIFEYTSTRGAKAAMIEWEQGVDFSYYHGGCLFEKADQYPTIQIVARYLDVAGKPAAVVMCKVGDGAALLSGIHFEYSNKNLSKYLINKILT